MGLWYRYDSGCLKLDDAKAVEWFRRAAEQGHIDAHWELGRMYHLGYGIDQDDKEAARWLRLAAEPGSFTGSSFATLRATVWREIRIEQNIGIAGPLQGT